MTDRSRGFAQGFGFALVTIALTTLGVSGQALAAAPKSATSQASSVHAPKVTFDATMISSKPASRTHVDIDPINPGVLHHWPDLSDSSADTVHNFKS